MSKTATTSPKNGLRGLSVERRFSTSGVHPFDQIEWEIRDAVIGNPEKPAFEQRGVEFPKTWSQNATNIVAQKYFRGRLGSPERESSVKQMIGRVSGTIANWGREGSYFASDEDADAFEMELTAILLNQKAAFNSPVWFNVGFEEQPQCSACFILSVEDTMESILDWNTKEGMIFRGGSGSGINLSNIRGSVEHLSKGGLASGPVSFMRGADAWAGTIKSGGKTRRAAKMVVLNVDHPDIEHFIWCKAKEEDKAAALRDAGFDMSIDGEGFTSIQYQNANNSVRVTDEFMEAVEAGEDWALKARVSGETTKTLDARELMKQISDAAWRCADPGVQYDTTINRWHTSPESGRINASNPCSEYMHVDNSACNLASLNLMKFRRPDGSFDSAEFEHAVDIVFLAQEIIVSPSSYPTEEIGDNARRFRQLGLGYANLGALLMSDGLPYDSVEGRNVSAAITALMTGRAYRQSALIAAGATGPYDEYERNREPHNGVMRMHRDASYDVDSTGIKGELLAAAQRAVQSLRRQSIGAGENEEILRLGRRKCGEALPLGARRPGRRSVGPAPAGASPCQLTRIRGSRTTRMMSASTAPIAVISAPNAATATAPWMSFLLIVWTKYSPIPCQAKTVSVITAPVNSAGIAKATCVATGMIEVRSPCRRIACWRVSPLARAVRTKSALMVSSSSER